MSVDERALGVARTRAEKARSRRARLSSVVEAPPRLKRVKPKRRKTLRRRYDLALPVELGAEIRLPAIPVIHPGPRLASVGLLLATIWVLTQVLRAPGLVTAEASVLGNKMLTPAQVRSMALTAGMPSYLIDPEQVAGILTAHSEIAAAQVGVGWPNRVELKIQEREPLVSWNDAGRKWWLSRDGVAFLQHGDWPGLAQVTTQEPALNITEDPLAPAISPDVLLAATALSAQLPEAGLLNYDPVKGLNFDDPRGWMAVFGAAGDMVLKVRLYRGIVDDLSQRGVAATLISVADPATPYYRTVR
jgi:cell division protein FtsQ